MGISELITSGHVMESKSLAEFQISMEDTGSIYDRTGHFFIKKKGEVIVSTFVGMELVVIKHVVFITRPTETHKNLIVDRPPISRRF